MTTKYGSLSALPQQSPTAFQGDATYSSPQELGIGVQQKKAATLERKKKGTSDNNSSCVPVPLPLQLEDENSEYARVADHVKMSPQIMGSLKRKSPTFAPPPPPLGTTPSPPPINAQLREEKGKEGGLKAYAQSHKRTPKDRGYDHLAKTGYDHLARKEDPSPTFAPLLPPLGTTPSPLPINAQLREEEGEEGGLKAYAQPHKRTPKDRGYDHLAKTGYDHLARKEDPSTIFAPLPLGTTPSPLPINEEGGLIAYAQPDKRTPLSSKDRGYDHLAKMSYDHLAPKLDRAEQSPTPNGEILPKYK